MVDPARILEILTGLRALKFFPDDPAVMTQLVKLVGRMAASEEQVEWLVDRMTISNLFTEWPGLAEVRAVFCSRFKPQDGISGSSAVYPGGIPSEKKQESSLPALPPGHKASRDPQLEASMTALAELKDMRNTLRKVKVPPIPLDPGMRITQEDIDRAVAEMREKKAREDLEK